MIIIFRALLGIALILMGIHGIYEDNANKFRITVTIERFETDILAPYNINMNLQLLKEHPLEIVYFQNIILIYGGFLLTFGFTLSKSYITSCFLLQFLLSYNLYFYRDDATIKHVSILISILGGILTIN